ncbi:MAG: molybdate ABC transporter substrate-binding protein [Desulfobacteraceae bacterium]|nr:molybdate ABC transporter substrate-binding protein [Desulfobacteraceae bacterium]
MKKIGTVYLLIALLYTALTSFAVSASAKEITVSAAMSLKNAFEEMGKLYESKTGTSCVFNFGASGDLLKQIAGGAPVDIFASAAKKDMDEADKQELTLAGTRADFALNSVVLVVPADAKTGLHSFEGLNSAAIKKIAVGNPKSVPAGRYAEEVFNFYNITASIRDKFIYTENVRQVLDYVARNEVDAGVVFATDAAVRTKEVKIVAAAPETSHKPAVYTVAVVKGSKYEAEARAFIALLLSGEGQAVLKNYGFKAVR